MPDSQSGDSRSLLDEFTDDTWFRVAVLTDDEFIAGVLKKNRRETVLGAIERGEPPLQALQPSASLGQGPSAAMMTWWYLACRNPPLKTTVKRL